MKNIKVLLVIDSLGSGGAQRQLVYLAKGLKCLGYDTEVFVYFPQFDFFRKEVLESGITIHEVQKRKKFSIQVIKNLAHLQRVNNYNIFISFLEVPTIYCEIARVISLFSFKLIACERSSINSYSSGRFSNIKRLLHIFSNAVVSNSFFQQKWLNKKFYLRNKTYVIYNGYDNKDSSIKNNESNKNDQQFTYLVVGRIAHYKNGLGLLNALVRYVSINGNCPVINWAGRNEKDSASIQQFNEINSVLQRNQLINNKWNWLGEIKDLSPYFLDCDALLHLSFFEGLPNAICEAFLHGRPVIASNVCEHPKLVQDGVRGFTCDPKSSDSIIRSIKKFECLTSDERNKLGTNAKAYANKHLSKKLMIQRYSNLIAELV